MLDIAIAAVIAVIVIVGLYMTRNVRGANPFDSVERDFDNAVKARGVDPYRTPELENPERDY